MCQVCPRSLRGFITLSSHYPDEVGHSNLHCIRKMRAMFTQKVAGLVSESHALGKSNNNKTLRCLYGQKSKVMCDTAQF